jgi:hypothetical protein
VAAHATDAGPAAPRQPRDAASPGLMAKLVVNGAALMCSMGTTPSQLVVPPRNPSASTENAAATIMDHIPMTNIMPFGMCISPANPQVAAATSAAAGVLTPQPCLPNTTSPWTPGNPVTSINDEPCLDDRCTCMCAWTGVVSITFAGQVLTDVP